MTVCDGDPPRLTADPEDGFEDDWQKVGNKSKHSKRKSSNVMALTSFVFFLLGTNERTNAVSAADRR